ncbi:fimbrial protein [Providencia rettgeri]|nr:fimbrial protein [Providencia rettgeri]ELL9156000.1 fimbrial protein [Providencia rettgeri]ELR5153081.1 fimbrial protein [Providencia rettgeri]
MKIRSKINVILGLWLIGITSCIAVTVDFDGTLIEDACDVHPNDESVELDFGTIVNKYLYAYTRTNSQPFTIRLINCDLSLGHQVKIIFTGIENQALPGLLAIDGGSKAKGIAVGIETESGKKININSGIYTQELISGNNNNLNFKAYVQGEPLALQNNSLNLGPWSATATFKLDYE